MKIALSGKGGAGKTTIASMLIHLYRQAGYKVYAVDADPNRHLGPALGFSEEKELTPILEMKKLIKERMGVTDLSFAPMFKMNPDVEDLPNKYALEHDGVRLMVLGGLPGGGTGCACPENVFLKNLLHEVITSTDEVVIADMEAGLEHFGRGTAEAVDVLLIIVEPSRASLDVARRAQKLAGDIRIRTIHFMGNKVRSDKEKRFLEEHVPEMLGFLPYSEEMLDGEREGVASWSRNPEILARMEEIRKNLEDKLKEAKQSGELKLAPEK